MRRASSSNPRALMALRLAASISAAMSRSTSSRTAKPWFTAPESSVPWYIAPMMWLWRASTAGRFTLRSTVFATCTSPCIASGTRSVKAMADVPLSVPASRFMKPER